MRTSKYMYVCKICICMYLTFLVTSFLSGNTLCKAIYVQRNDTCSMVTNGHSANWRVHLTSSDWLKVDFGYMVQWQQIHRTAEGQRTTAFHCTMYLHPLDHVSKNQLSTNQSLLNARANSRNDRWTRIIPLDMYRLT